LSDSCPLRSSGPLARIGRTTQAVRRDGRIAVVWPHRGHTSREGLCLSRSRRWPCSWSPTGLLGERNVEARDIRVPDPPSRPAGHCSPDGDLFTMLNERPPAKAGPNPLAIERSHARCWMCHAGAFARYRLGTGSLSRIHRVTTPVPVGASGRASGTFTSPQDASERGAPAPVRNKHQARPTPCMEQVIHRLDARLRGRIAACPQLQPVALAQG
jgi:hypothetical protein